jgi:hypothetical protein
LLGRSLNTRLSLVPSGLRSRQVIATSRNAEEPERVVQVVLRVLLEAADREQPHPGYRQSAARSRSGCDLHAWSLGDRRGGQQFMVSWRGSRAQLSEFLLYPALHQLQHTAWARVVLGQRTNHYRRLERLTWNAMDRSFGRRLRSCVQIRRPGFQCASRGILQCSPRGSRQHQHARGLAVPIRARTAVP